jgi:hypothetical protein
MEALTFDETFANRRACDGNRGSCDLPHALAQRCAFYICVTFPLSFCDSWRRGRS